MKKSSTKRLLSYITVHNKLLIISLLTAIINVFFTLLNPILIGDAIDFIIGKDNVDFQGILKIIGILILSIILASLSQWIMTRCTNVITYKTVAALREDVFNKINKVPLKYIDSHSHGDIMSRIINDIDQISTGLLQGFSQLFTGIITILGTLGIMIAINFKIALVVVLMTPLSILVGGFIAKSSKAMFTEQSKIRGEITGYTQEMIGNQKLVKAFSYENNSEEKFQEINSRLYTSGVKSQFFSSLTNPCTRFVNGIVYATVGIISAISAINGNISIGKISSFLNYANQYTKPFNEISSVITELQSALASAERVFEVLDEENEPLDKENAINLKECNGNIEIKDVSFSYNPDVKLIENFNLSVKKGEKIAIVGPTGCGKTTLINLLMRFYNINSGEIFISGYNINDITRKSSRAMFGMVLQETWLYSGTIKENIAYGKPNATDKEIIEAAKMAHAHEFITRLPNGYDTKISGDGNNISQGQKQLLCIARIMLTKPPMLILDEATSSIDTRTEIFIQNAFNKMMEGRTSFIVAHRLSTIKEADLILVMNKGHIIEQGTHEELIEKKGFYANLYNSQFSVPIS
ncbi:MAG: ABC transporter ATP-binding protein [Clostridium sp.]|nr:ABC transporter ATP-binding protein [Clostridium sp.]